MVALSLNVGQFGSLLCLFLFFSHYNSKYFNYRNLKNHRCCVWGLFTESRMVEVQMDPLTYGGRPVELAFLLFNQKVVGSYPIQTIKKVH